MKFYVYVLRSEKDGKRYIGMSKNVQRRLEQHNSGKVKSTNSRRPLKLVYCEVLEQKEAALAQEKFFKTGKGREYLQQKGA